MAYRFPIARKLLAFASRARRNWLPGIRSRSITGSTCSAFRWRSRACRPFVPPPWYYGVGAIVLGYLFQWIGHRVEGNDVGEFIPVKRLLGLPVVAVAPRWC